MMNKMTNKTALEFVLANCEVPADVHDKLVKMVEALDKKSGGERKPTKTQQENAVTAELVLEVLALSDSPKTITEIQKSDERFEDFSNQKMAAIVRGLVKDEKVERTEVKGRAYFSVKG